MGTNTSVALADDRPNYGLNLTRYLEAEWDAKGTTRAAWCRRLGLADSTVLRWAQNVNPDLPNLMVVARGVGLTLPQLLVVCGYVTEAEAKVKAPPPRERPTIEEALRLARDISDQERDALLSVHQAFEAAKDGRKRTTRISNR